MRNLKRALSLGLTAAMISGLMVMGSSAAGYADVTSEQNEEAIEVLQTIGIMIGDESGNFNPDQNVTRNQMAVIMANLMEYNVANYRDTSPFTDVPSWAEPYVAACYTNKITSGYSDTIYGGEDSVTTAQAALMLMKALGYFQYASDFGSDWQLATLKQGNDIDLFLGVDSRAEDPLTRNDVAQLVLNTLEAGTVQASTNGSWVIGDVTVTSGVQYDYITSNQAYARAIDDKRTTNNDGDLVSGSIVELGEQLYMGDLKLNDSTDDEFMRPSRSWSYDGAEIGTYVKKDLIVATYTTGVTGREVYDLLTSSTVREYEMDVYLNGGTGLFDKDDVKRTNNDDLDQTGNGVLTEVFLDLDNKEITITSVDTWLAKANSDYNTTSETLSLKVYDEATDGTEGYTQVIDPDDVAGIEDIVKDQFVLVNMSIKDRSNYEIVAISDPEIITDATVTKFSTNEDGDKNYGGESLFDSLTADGTEYDSAQKALYDEDVLNLYDQELLTDNTYNVFVDPYGYAIGVELYEGTKNYVFIAGYDMNSSNIAVRTADAAAIFMDGTMETIEVNVTNTNKNIDVNGNGNYTDDFDKYTKWDNNGTDNGDWDHNRWYTYTENNGVYTLRPVGDDNMLITNYASYDQTINCSNVWVSDKTDGIRGYGNDDSVYITVEPGEVTTGGIDSAITEVSGLYTGVQNVEIVMRDGYKQNVPDDIYTVTDKDQYIVASVVVGEAQGDTANYAYILDPVVSEERLEDGTYLWEFEAVMGGTIQTLTARSEYQDVITVLRQNAKKVVELRFDGDYVVNAKAVAADVTAFTQQIDAGDDEIFDVSTNGGFVNLFLTGRTLHTGDMSTGLTVTNDALAVLTQAIRTGDGKKDVEYGSVQEAYDNLGDGSAADGVQFKGRIVAVLNSQGVAEWVYIDSDVPADNSAEIIDDGYSALYWDVATSSYVSKYHGNMTTSELREYIINAAEDYFGLPVRTCEIRGNQARLLLEDYLWPVTVTLDKVWAVTGNGKVQYFSESAGSTTISGMKANTAYLQSGTAAAISTGALIADPTGDVTLPSLTKDITLVEAYQVEVGTGVTKVAAGGVSASGAGAYIWVPSAALVQVTGTTIPAGSAKYSKFVDQTGKDLTSAVYVAAGSANVKNVRVYDDVEIDEVTGYMVTVDGREVGMVTDSPASSVTFTGYDNVNTHFAAGANRVAGDVFSGLAALTGNVNGWTYTYSASDKDNVKGTIDLFEVTKVDSIETGLTVKCGTQNVVTGQYVAAEKTLTIEAAALAAGEHIQVSVNGGNWIDLGNEGTSAPYTTTYTLPAGTYEVDFRMA